MDIKQLIERVRSDPEFALKYAALNGFDAITVQAAKDGYFVTKEEVKEAIRSTSRASGELSEADLAVVSGGKGLPDLWDADACMYIIQPSARCLGGEWIDFDPFNNPDTLGCTHYKYIRNDQRKIITIKCNKGRFELVKKM